MKDKVKYVIYGVLFVIVCAAVYYIWQDIKKDNEQLKTEITEAKQLTDTLYRSSSEWTTKKDLERLVKENFTVEEVAALQKDMKKMNSELVGIQTTIARLDGKVSKWQPSTSEKPNNNDVPVCPDNNKPIDIHGYTKNVQELILTDNNEAELASTKFDASSEKPWQYTVFPRDYYVNTVITKKPDGQEVHTSTLKYSVNGSKKYSLDIKNSNLFRKFEPETRQFFIWNPRLDLNAFIGSKIYQLSFGDDASWFSAGLDVGFTTSSYGLNRDRSLFRVLRIGIGYDTKRRSAKVSIAPISYNFAEHLPLFTNLYITPAVGLDTKGGLTLTVGVGPKF